MPRKDGGRSPMRRHYKQVAHKAGMSPGSLMPSGEISSRGVRVDLISYDEAQIVEQKNVTIAEALKQLSQTGVTWINIDGIHDTSIVETLGRQFNLHPLVLEDITTTGQRPKLEDYGDYLFVTIKMLSLDPQTTEVVSDELSVLFGPHYVLTIHENESDVFEPVRERLRKGSGKLRKSGPDYLAYALIDAVVDNYFVVFEQCSSRG